GLVWDDTNSNAFYADADGSVWIGTSRGLSHHFPLRRDEEFDPVPPQILDVTDSGKSFEPNHPIRVNYHHNNIVVTYAALTFRWEKEVRFRYRMRGWDRSWIETDEWEVRYHGLPPGAYVLEVAAGTWDGRWNPNVARVPITIVGPWWRTWWC